VALSHPRQRIGIVCAQALGFLLAGEPYLVPVDRVREVVHGARPRAVPGTPPWLRGLISLRGRLVPVCDLAARLAVAGEPGPTTIVLAAADDSLLGLLVEEVRGIVELDDAALGPLPVGNEPLFAGIAELGGELVVALDVERLAAEIDQTRPARAPERQEE